MRDDPPGMNRHEQEEAEAVQKLEVASEVPPEVWFAAWNWAGDWTEGIVPQVRTTPTGWAFDYDGEWFVMDRGRGVYEVRVDQELVADVYAMEPDHFVIVSAENGEAVKCRLDPDGLIVELGVVEE